ncbi:MAG TPA: thiamine pyrophosphate-binding protein, partial [Acidimicrobiales bacterium]|nr:thiamine pyrophosphate-binding protein [Acidimicrobiales bacterium]
MDDPLPAALSVDPDTKVAGSGIDALATALLLGDVRRFLTVPGSPATRLADALVARGAEVINAHDEKTAIETALGLALVGVRAGVIAKGNGGLVLAEALQNAGPHEIGGLLVLLGDDPAD